ncbi:hypothetical protein TTHERM_00694480 (macronuclear) [Tetrahymena thermophila SB210]|uniref:Uncharacterized protein n=1 Tax=Tetrahymena thermophila (strain SB210) TaxID=312017 RepID=Q244W9_TETTS|nr:hypothetical protein TTHERM_00694480 [Tetrahymena thermophila SB210]EAS03368.2 hypothetical protein TTHERM_00694480 [Tetrahymena thermophila SB210]|eukprot:XP_001023613.2 hypothetical protein TTHERM_00694480 [Tetrahymena thermophila SB210]
MYKLIFYFIKIKKIIIFIHFLELDSMKERPQQEQTKKDSLHLSNQIKQTPQKQINIEIESLTHSDQNQYIFQLDQLDENSKKLNQINLLEQISLNQDTDYVKNSIIQPLKNTQSIKGFQKNQNLVINQDDLELINVQKQLKIQQNEQNPFNIFSKIEQLQADNDEIITISQQLEAEKQD